MRENFINLLPYLLGVFAGILVAYWLNSQSALAMGGGPGLDVTVFLVVSAPAIVILSILVLMVTGTNAVGKFVSSFSACVELGIMIFGAQVLVMWYMDPDNPHLEPLFVIVGVALVGIEYGRSWVRTFEKASFVIHKKNSETPSASDD